MALIARAPQRGRKAAADSQDKRERAIGWISRWLELLQSAGDNPDAVLELPMTDEEVYSTSDEARAAGTPYRNFLRDKRGIEVTIRAVPTEGITDENGDEVYDSEGFVFFAIPSDAVKAYDNRVKELYPEVATGMSDEEVSQAQEFNEALSALSS